MKALFLLDFTLLFKPFGEIIFAGLIRTEYSWVPFVELLLGLIYIILPKGTIFDFIHQERFLPTYTTYSELKNRKKHMSY